MRRALTIASFAALAALASGQQARELGPAPIVGDEYTGRVSAVACSPTDAGLYYVAGADGGVWRTRDGGATWEPLTDRLMTTAVGAIALDPADERTIYVGTGEANFANHSRYGLGILKSTDRGDSWTHLAEETFAGRCFSRIIVDPTDSAVVYAAVTRAGGFPEMAAAREHPQRSGPLGVFKSTDGGETWRRLEGLPDRAATDLAIDFSNPSVLYAAIGHIFGSSENGIYRTTDGGETWTRLTSGLPSANVGRISLAVAPGRPQTIYALVARQSSASGGGASNIGGFRSDDGGETWRAHGGVDQATYGWYLNFVAVHPTDHNIVFYGGLRLARGNNGSFSNVTPPHVDMHAMAFDAAGRVLCGNDGGIHRSTNLGSSWTPLNTGLGIIQFYAGLSTHPGDRTILFGGTQDNGTNRRNTDTRDWRMVLGGDGGWTQLDQTRPNRVFGEYQGTGNLSRSTNGGGSFSGAGSGINGGDRNCFLPPYLIDPSNADRMIYATHRIYQSLNGGTSWSAISGDLTGGAGAIRAIAMAPTNPSRVYAATNDGRVLASSDGGATFEVRLTQMPGWPRVTRELCVDPADPDTVYLAISAFGGDRVIRSHDAGRTWSAIGGDLPDVPVNVVAVEHACPSRVLYAGSDHGLYRSMDDGRTWRRFGVGMPHAPVIDLVLDRARARLIVGTQGRGAWEIPTSQCAADFTGDGRLDIRDFFAFQSAFARGDVCADLDGNSILDIRDFFAFQALFAGGC